MKKMETIETKAPERYTLNAGSLVAAGSQNAGRKEYRVRFIKAGRVRRQGNTPSNIEIPAEPLKAALEKGLFDARASFVDHAGWFSYPSLRNLVGVTFDAHWNEEAQSVDGIVRLYGGPTAQILSGLLDGMIQDASEEKPVPDVGLSLVFWPKWKLRDRGEDPLILAEIGHIESCDFVFEPGAEGRVKDALSALASLDPKLEIETGMLGEANTAPSANGKLRLTETVDSSGKPAAPKTGSAPELNQIGGSEMQEENQINNGVETAKDAHPTQGADWIGALQEAGAAALIGNSGLPAASRERLAAMRFDSPEDVRSAIEAERQYLARLAEDQVVQLSGPAPRSPQISIGMTGLEQLQLAADALLAGEYRPQKGVPPLSGIRELYTLLSGDYEMMGLYQPERVHLANVTSATMAGLVANALTKQVVNLFQEYPRWWERIVSIEDFTNLQQVKWVTLGGVPELPTVAEGAAYTELNWDDQTESADFVKKGGYLGVTLETIDKDDTRKVQAAPRALAQAAWLALSKIIALIFSANAGAGPNLSDGSALFSAPHGNLGASALSFTAWAATRTAMRKQTELNSAERLGALTAPKYLVVPPDLEITALQVLASEQQPGQANADENPFAEGDYHNARMISAEKRVVVCDLWTDTNNWAAVADPHLYPTIGLGFRYGRQPEIFSVASPTAGLMFTNDVMPVKVRFFFAVGPMDYRGMYKHNVA